MDHKIRQPTKKESRIIKFLILLGIVSILNFLFFFFRPEHVGNIFLFILLAISISYGILKKFYLWYNYSNISVPKIKNYTSKLKVDILTTYFPGEPYQMTITTLEAINDITYPHTTYLCDEANDPFLKDFCKKNGIIHVTRDDRKDAKAGNINNTLSKYATGDICVILDPDHIPEPNFLDPILPFFEDPKIGFVQIVQSYYNIKDTLVAQAAAEQTYQFYGPMMMTLNSYGAVNAIGANCVFRRAALDSIGGHAPGLCEDMHTAMLLYSKKWKAVYLPLVLAKGLAPSNLTNFFKQQLKWSRGTFDLLVNVYPKVFSKLSLKQKIHFGLLPLHYLGGVISLINFLIPLLSLLFFATPWRGDIIEFVLVSIPVLASSILVKIYIQKWVIERKERGFHILGGLLHINTWWIYITGLVYTIVDKRVPYLPTPKENEWNTNYRIVIPNAVVAGVSVFAVIYGLRQDLTPFSIIMAGFALFNASVMLFGIYLSHRVTNQNLILRTYLRKKVLELLQTGKGFFQRVGNYTFRLTRKTALPLLLLFLITAMSIQNQNQQAKWEKVPIAYPEKESGRYLGIFNPFDESGLSDMQKIGLLEKEEDVNFDIASFYIAWDEESISEFPHPLISTVFKRNAIPLITWEPWSSYLPVSDTIKALSDEQKVFKHISEAYFDDYITDFVNILKTYDKPIFLRFGHEFDNPQYPWSHTGNNTPEEFKAAWRHIHGILKKQGLHKVMMVWNPWKAETMAEYYPGDEFVDWVGITLLHYGPFNPDGNYYSFKELYNPFYDELEKLTRKPVMLTEFGAVKLETQQEEWLLNGIRAVNSDFSEISALVVFNSAFDKNIPDNDWYAKKHIDWTTNSFKKINSLYDRQLIKPENTQHKIFDPGYVRKPVTTYEIKGVRYNKGKDWINNYHVLSKEELLSDFELMKDTGINTILYTGGNIYDRNFLKYSLEHDLKVIYEFEIEHELDFIKDTEKLQNIKENITTKVNSLKENNNIIGYSFPYNLKKRFNKPLLFNQEIAFLNWLNSVIKEIKDIDPERSVIVELDLGPETIWNIQRIAKNPYIDSFGLTVEEMNQNLDEVISFGKEKDIPILISNLRPAILENILCNYEKQDVILENWQDKRMSDALTFNGLIDFKGNQKVILKNIKSLWTDYEMSPQEVVIEILKPSQRLLPGETFEYHALLFHENNWLKASKDDLDHSFEWNLVKTDEFGNPLAVKTIGTGPILNLEIPEVYENFKLMLIAKNKKQKRILKTFSQLHTPAKIDL